MFSDLCVRKLPCSTWLKEKILASDALRCHDSHARGFMMMFPTRNGISCQGMEEAGAGLIRAVSQSARVFVEIWLLEWGWGWGKSLKEEQRGKRAVSSTADGPWTQQRGLQRSGISPWWVAGVGEGGRRGSDMGWPEGSPAGGGGHWVTEPDLGSSTGNG